MKFIPENLIQSVEASSEYNSTYAVANLLDEHPKNIFQGADSSAVLLFHLSGTTSGFAIFNTNATGVSFQLIDPNEIDWNIDWNIDWDSEILNITEIVDLDGVSGACMAQWEEIKANVILRVTLANANGENITAGVAVGGKVYTYPGPNYSDFEEGDVDYSTVNELENGATDIKVRDTARDFNLSCSMKRDTKFHEFSNLTRKVLKSRPTAWLVTNLNNSRWLVYARITKRPRGRHSMLNRTKVRFSLLEVL